jgi:putative CRISPR-associated protein (TIGR02619 family)
MNSLILSPVGTSIFTKGAFPQEISKYSNCRKLEDIPSDRRRIITDYIAQTRDLLLSMSVSDVKVRSAELNGIIQYYHNDLRKASQDVHYLLPSDTYIGKQSCLLVQEYLQQYFSDVRVMEISDLQTSDCESFQYALSELTSRIMCLRDELSPGQNLVFNLTGGFKSILGFLQSLGMFYADETVYVFEFSESLLRLPILPLRLEPFPYLLEYVSVFRRLDNSLPVSSDTYQEIPSTLVLNLFGEPTLSAYGKIVWDSFRKQIYSQNLLDSLSNRIRYSEGFKPSVLDLEADRYYHLNSRIDTLAVYMESNNTKAA